MQARFFRFGSPLARQVAGMRPNPKLRSSSWVIAASSILMPGTFLVHELAEFEKWAETNEGGVCGMTVFAIWILAIGACVTLSLVASTLNGMHLWRSRPAATRRYLELGAVAAPAIAALGVALFVAVSL